MMAALSVAPLFPPVLPWQWKSQLVLTEMGAWFAGVCLAGGIAAGVRRKRGMSSFFLALVFLLAAFLFFKPWWQFLSARPAWNDVMTRVFGSSVPTSISGASPVERDVVFGEGRRIRFYFPPTGDVHPWIVSVHAGGWDSGGVDAGRWLHRRLARRGWVVAVPNYRLAPDHRWPAQRDDVAAAVHFLKANAAAFGLDTTRWALLGRSSGGQIAERLAYGSHDPSLKGLIALYAPSDLTYAYTAGREDDLPRTRPMLRRLIGGSPGENPASFADASPLTFVTPQAPPTLLIHGPSDPVVSSAHSRRLALRLAEAHVPVVLIEPPWATQGFDFFPSGPGGRLTDWVIARFLTAIFQ
jgi:acetyl esterase/lipase